MLFMMNYPGTRIFWMDVSGELICALSEEAMSRAALLKKLNELLEAPSESEMESYLDDFIARFQQLGLLDIE